MSAHPPVSAHHDRARCPFCGRRIDVATNAFGDATPTPGDFAVCIVCARVAVFEEGGTVRPPVPGELRAIPSETAAQLERVQRAIRQLRSSS